MLIPSNHFPAMKMPSLPNRPLSLAKCVLAFVLVAGSLAAFAASTDRRAASPAKDATVCDSCGTIASVKTYRRPAGHGSQQVTDGRTTNGYVGKIAASPKRSRSVTRIKVKMDNGAFQSFFEDGTSQWTPGEKVVVSNGKLVSQGGKDAAVKKSI
ncbi:hypothetical protein SAMN06265795_103182 [Noviherbaspirillum humi]|uniref:Uncharacterized protein n=2 Tax=Noviherbaspirillum humi TaxID=1688639 RepID=A0A239F516_9BURK|nr:hypothetical protein SAMN06265795_103182 [Noviherbaspirillum humi]